MTNKEKELYESCWSFKNYSSIDDYIKDVRECLILGDYHYSAKEADTLIDEQRNYIERVYDARDPACKTALGIGFGCG